MRAALPPLVLAALVAAHAGVAQAADYDAAFVGQTVPDVIEIGARASVTITMRNTGTAVWQPGDVFLATQEPQDNYYWCIQDNPYGSHSGNRVVLAAGVLPGDTVTFTFDVEPLACRFAAASPLRFRMLSQLHGTFGEETPDPHADVTTAADFVAQQMPTVVPAGASFSASVSYHNSTKTTWTAAAGYALGSPTTGAHSTWGFAPVAVPVNVAPDAVVRFPVQLSAPVTPGTYNVQWQMSVGGRPFGVVSPAADVNVVEAGAPNYGGLWWAAPAGSEAGWGINLAHQGDTIYLTWFTYDAAGAAWWLSMVASLGPDGSYSGPLVSYTGPAFDAVPFNPLLVQGTAVGTGALTFKDANDGSFAYTVNGVSGTKAITRQAFGPLPTCTFGLVPDLSVAYNYQDLWWASPAGAESGWGLNLAHEGDIIFATWFTYAADGTPTWVSATAPRTGDGTYAGTIVRTTGPAFDAATFDPAAVTRTNAGSMTLTFTDGNDATFAYTLDGVSQVKTITRQIFDAPGTICQ